MTTSNPFRNRIEQAAKDGYLTRPRTYVRPSAAADFPAPAEPMVTTKQLDLLDQLWDERDLPSETRPTYRARLGALCLREARAELTRDKASALIEYLFGLPLRPRAEAPAEKPEDEFASVPAGRYAVTVNGELWFVKVDRPTEGKWAGRVFVKRQNGGELTRLYTNVQRRVLNNIATQGPATCAAEFGHKIGRCGVCNTPLTNEESRAYGIGPVCRTKNGW